MTDKVLITGATGTLGQELVRGFAAAHADVAVHFRSDEGMAARLCREVESHGGRAVALQQDFELEDIEGAVSHFVARMHVELGAPNVVVLNAAAQDVVEWDELTAADWDHMYSASFRSTAVLLHKLAHDMESLPDANRVIVLVGSIEGLRPARGHATYGTMKAALHHLVLAAAHELGPKGVRVVGVAPGLIDHVNLSAAWPSGLERWNSVSAMSRPVTAAEVAAAVQFLASPSASGITGVVLPVDAGWSAHPGW